MSAPFNEFGPFAVGEICRVVSAENFPELIGCEVTIAGPCQRVINAQTGELYDGYPIDLNHKGYKIFAKESSLRRRKPPSTGEQSVMQMFVAPQRVGETV